MTPTKPNLFKFGEGQPIVEKAKFHSMVAKLRYLGKRGRPDILLPVQFLCTRVKAPTTDDEKKQEQVLGYLQLTKAWTKVFDKAQLSVNVHTSMRPLRFTQMVKVNRVARC